MPLYENNLIVEVAHGIKAFVDLRVGITRGLVPEPDTPIKEQQFEEARIRLQHQIKSERQQSEKVRTQLQHQIKNQKQQLERLRKGLLRKKQQESQLRNELSQRETPRDPGSVSYEGMTLPPKNLRPGVSDRRDDARYVESAGKEVDRLVADLGLTEESSLLDVGSGPGRLAIGILSRIGGIRRYCGVDVSEDSTRWGWKYITSQHPNFQFLHIDVENTRYNPDGAASDSDFSFPFGDGEFDIVVLYSVFTHMMTEGVRTYLKEFARILRPDGRIFLTAFLEEDVPDAEENPEGYLGVEWKEALHSVRYNQQFFEGLLDEAGFKLDGFDTPARSAKSTGEKGKRGLYISRKDA